MQLHQRIAIIVRLVRLIRPPPREIAIVQGLYALQDVYGVSLGYHFRLYSYGPCDFIAVHDLELAESFKMVRRELVDVAGRYHDYVYHVARNPRRELYADVAARIADAAALVSGRSGAALELLGTILFCDRANLRADRVATRDQLIEQVHAVRPFQPVERIAAEVDSLRAKGLLAAIATQSSGPTTSPRAMSWSSTASSATTSPRGSG